VSSRRTAILIGAIAVGILAVVLIWQYVRGVENKLYEDTQPKPVFVAGATIPRGTAGEQSVSDHTVHGGSVPQGMLPATAITSTDEVQKKVALFDIPAGTVILRGMFVDPSTTQISFRERLKNKSHVAISVQVDQVHGVGGFLVPGDEVNIMVLPKPESGGTTYPDPTKALTPTASARMLYQKVQILAVGQTELLSPGEQADTAAAPGGGSGLLTFNVPAQAAQYLASFQDMGFYLTLVPKDYQPKALAPLDPSISTLPGENPSQLCPYFEADDIGCAKVG
jgi:Flp pilus assembly protein CpaB